MVKISIIMPVFNGEKFIKSSIESVLSQSLQEIELICVDDGSTDHTNEILEQYSSSDKRVVVLTQENKGSGAARNYAIQESHGKYLAFLDCDDFYPNDYTLERLYNTITTENVKIAGGSFSWYYCRQIITDFPEDLALYTFSKNGLVQYRDYQFDYGYHRFLYDSEFIKEKKIQFPDLLRFQDVPFFVQAMIEAKEFYAITDVTYCYRKRIGGNKPAEWSSRKVQDMLKGITTNLKLSKKEELKQLHIFSWNHFISPDFYKAVNIAIERNNYETMSLVKELLLAVDESIVIGADEQIHERKRELIERIDECFNQKRTLAFDQEVPSKIKISAIVPCLNVEPYIRKCIESILRQTLKDIEILCVDAGSSDGTIEILQEYEKMDPRIKVIHSDKKSYGYQVNLAIRQAKGDYIAIVESDDYIEPEMFLELYNKAEDNSLEVVKGDYYISVGDGRDELTEYHQIVPDECYESVLSGDRLIEMIPTRLSDAIYIWAGLYNKKFICENEIFCQETPGASFQDNGFWYQILMNANRMSFVKKPFYHLRRDNPNSSVLAHGKRDCMKQEFDYIHSRIERISDKTKKEKWYNICAFYRYKNYMFTYNRLYEMERLDYLKDMQAEFLGIESDNELDMKIFPKEDQIILTRIMEEPEEYYLSKSNKKARIMQVPGNKEIKNKWQKLLEKCGYGFIYWSENGLMEMAGRVIKSKLLHRTV